MDQRRVGVEEELLLVDPGTGQPRAVSRAVLRRAGTASEGELLRVATWRAGKSGLRAGLVHPQTGRPVPAEVAVQALLQHVTPVLAESTELATVRELVRVVLDRGTGADAQRAAFEPNGLLADVVDHAVARTVPAPCP